MNISILEHKPDTPLEPFIESFWNATFNLDEAGSFSHNIVPNGCIELIIHLTQNHCRLSRSGSVYEKSPPFTLIGVYDKPYIVKFPARVKTFGIRFHPDGFKNIFGIPPGKFISTYEDGTSVAGKNIEEFSSGIQDLYDFSKQAGMANQFFLSQLVKNHNPHDYTHLAMQLIRQKHGLIGIDELKKTLPVSIRQLQRLFKLHYGMTITNYIRLSRLNTVRKSIISGSTSLTKLAYELGFSDQSHFIKEFKNFTGISPNGFIKQLNEFSANAV